MIGSEKSSMRIKVLNGKNELYIESYQNQNLLTVLMENNVVVSNVCHGNGICGKCKIKVVVGYLPITEGDKICLTEDELKQGIRLACKAKIEREQETLWIEIVGNSEEDIVVEGIDAEKKSECYNEKDIYNSSNTERQIVENKVTEDCFIAIDIGTTTIAMALVNEETGEVLDVYTSLNHQRKYGADVISRIVVANNGKGEELKRSIEEDLWKGIQKLLETKDEVEADLENDKEQNHVLGKKINLNRIIVVGNTTMIHLFMGYSCEFLGKYPFRSEHLEKIECTLKECITFNNIRRNSRFAELPDVPITILSGISAFVGGDIVAGILACGGFETEKLSLLLDLGTNGEIVLGNKSKILATSTAAGPAFEGGNITCGTASISGSVSQVKIQNQRAIVRTIKNEMPPKGICGTGLISVIAELRRNRLVNEEGVLKKPYDEKGFSLWTFEHGEKIALYQKDIREFQMAKAAIRAGVDILMEEYGCTSEDIKNVYIAGGFGKALNLEDILTIGIMPEEFKDKINIIGNSALQGAVCFGKDSEKKKRVEDICQRAGNIFLSENTKFRNKYIEYMTL